MKKVLLTLWAFLFLTQCNLNKDPQLAFLQQVSDVLENNDQEAYESMIFPPTEDGKKSVYVELRGKPLKEDQFLPDALDPEIFRAEIGDHLALPLEKASTNVKEAIDAALSQKSNVIYVNKAATELIEVNNEIINDFEKITTTYTPHFLAFVMLPLARTYSLEIISVKIEHKERDPESKRFVVIESETKQYLKVFQATFDK